MSRRALIAGFLPWIFSAAAFGASGRSAEARTGALAGRTLLAADKGVAPMAGVIVRLRAYKGDEIVAGAETRSDAGGNFRFPGLPAEDGYRYRAQAIHNGVPFDGTFVSFPRGKNSVSAPDLVVIPVTGSTESLSVTELFVVEFGRTNLLKIRQSLHLTNRGSLTYDGRAEDGKPIEVALPEGGSRPEFLAGLSAENAEIDAAAKLLRLKVRVPPGPEADRRVEFGYVLQYDSRSLSFKFPLAVARESFTAVLSGRDLKLESDQIASRTSRELNGRTYFIYSGGPFGAGQSVAFGLKGLSLPKDLPIRLTAAGLGLVLALGVLLAVRKPRANVTARKLDEAEGECFRELLELERAYRRGTLKETQYRGERERLTEELIAVRHSRRADGSA